MTDFTLNTKKANGKSPPQKPGEFWRTQGEDADQVAELLTAEEIARAVDALNFTLVAFGVPDKFRAYIDGLIGVSGGCLDWFEAADIEIAQRAREVTSRGLKEKSLEKWTQRNREEFADWERLIGVTLVEAMPGGKHQGQNYKSRYRIAGIFLPAIETDRRARLSSRFEKNSKRELRKAAAAVYAEFRAGLNEPPKRQRFRKSRQTCDTYLKLITTYLEKLCGRAIVEHKDLLEILDGISLILKQKRELLNNSTAHFSDSDQSQQSQTVTESRRGDKLSTQKTGAENGFVHTINTEKSVDKNAVRRGVL